MKGNNPKTQIQTFVLDLHAAAKSEFYDHRNLLEALRIQWFWPELTSEDFDDRYLPIEIIEASIGSTWVDKGSVNVRASKYGLIENVPQQFIKKESK